MTENEIATIIVDAAYKIHKRLGPGLLESVYETTLAYELAKRGLQLRRQQSMPVVYEAVRMDDERLAAIRREISGDVVVLVRGHAGEPVGFRPLGLVVHDQLLWIAPRPRVFGEPCRDRRGVGSL